jgi:hypothetical protein
VLQTSVPSVSNPTHTAETPVVDHGVGDTDDERTAGLAGPEEFAEPTVADEPVSAPAPDLMQTIVEHLSFGDDIIQAQIAAAPGTAAVAWTPMPYDVPADGVAYVCLGASDKGCMFVDLGRAPGPVSVSGDPAAAARLVESIAFQLTAALEPDRASVTVVGDVGTDIELGQVGRAGTLGQIVTRGPTTQQGDEPLLELVICSVDDARDDTALAWLTSDRSRTIVPIVLGGLANAPWSLTVGAPSLTTTRSAAATRQLASLVDD